MSHCMLYNNFTGCLSWRAKWHVAFKAPSFSSVLGWHSLRFTKRLNISLFESLVFFLFTLSARLRDCILVSFGLWWLDEMRKQVFLQIISCDSCHQVKDLPPLCVPFDYSRWPEVLDNRPEVALHLTEQKNFTGFHTIRHLNVNTFLNELPQLFSVLWKKRLKNESCLKRSNSNCAAPCNSLLILLDQIDDCNSLLVV